MSVSRLTFSNSKKQAGNSGMSFSGGAVKQHQSTLFKNNYWISQFKQKEYRDDITLQSAANLKVYFPEKKYWSIEIIT